MKIRERNRRLQGEKRFSPSQRPQPNAEGPPGHWSDICRIVWASVRQGDRFFPSQGKFEAIDPAWNDRRQTCYDAGEWVRGCRQFRQGDTESLMDPFANGMPGRTGVMSLTRVGKLIGEDVGSWSSMRRGIIVEVGELPGPIGQVVARYLTNREMKSLSEHYEGVEFVLIRGRLVGGSYYYYLMSGRAGELGRVRFNISRGQNLVSHTHPLGGDAFASRLDLRTLDFASNDVSRIVLLDGRDGQLISFSAINPRISLRSLTIRR